MKTLVCCLTICLFQVPAKADPICSCPAEPAEAILPGYGTKFSYEPWNQSLKNPKFAAWNQSLDSELQEKVRITALGTISTQRPLQNKFTITMSGLSQKIFKVHCLESSSNPQFDTLCEKVIRSLDGSEKLKCPKIHQTYMFKPISFEMPVNHLNDGSQNSTD